MVIPGFIERKVKRGENAMIEDHYVNMPNSKLNTYKISSTQVTFWNTPTLPSSLSRLLKNVEKCENFKIGGLIIIEHHESTLTETCGN